MDEDSLLEALIREEEAQNMPDAVEESPDAVVGISVDDLDSFTLDGASVADEDDEDEEEEEEALEIVEMPVLTPDAGKIRFAEDIVEDIRGGGRRGRWPAAGRRRLAPSVAVGRQKRGTIKEGSLAQTAAHTGTNLRGLRRQEAQAGTGAGCLFARWWDCR